MCGCHHPINQFSLSLFLTSPPPCSLVSPFRLPCLYTFPHVLPSTVIILFPPNPSALQNLPQFHRSPIFFSSNSSFHECVCRWMTTLCINILRFNSQLHLVWELSCSRACNAGIAQYNAKRSSAFYFKFSTSSLGNLGQCIWSLWTVISSCERWKAIQM